MSDKPTYNEKHNQPQHYEIRLKGHLDSQWTDWFGGLTLTLEEDGTTLLSGPVADQAALHGLLKRGRDLGMPLISVSPVEPGKADGTANSASGEAIRNPSLPVMPVVESVENEAKSSSNK